MKSKLLIFCMLFFSQELTAQSAAVQTEVFSLTKNQDMACPQSDIGKIYYHTPTNTVKYCGADLLEKVIMSYWEGNSDIYYMGKVGISKSSPLDELDISDKARFNTLLVNEKVGINTSTPTEKLEIVNRRIDIKSTANEKSYTLINIDAGDKFVFQENGQAIMNIKYGGNIIMGNISETAKLNIEGNVSYAGSVSIEGKGILANTNATQLVMRIITTTPTIVNFHIDNNTCSTSGFSFPIAPFAQPPVVVLGQKNGGTYNEDKLVISIENVTAGGGVIRFCNNSGANIALPNTTFSLIAIGQ